MTAETAAASTVHHPFGKPGGPGLFHVKGMQLPAYIQNIAHALLRDGSAKDEGSAIQMAIGIVKNWASGRGKVHPDVRAAAAKAVAQWEAAKARAHVNTSVVYDAFGNVLDLVAASSAPPMGKPPTAAHRAAALAEGKALPSASGGGSGAARFPITNKDQLRKAIAMVGLAKGDPKPIRRFIMARAKAMGLSDMIPAQWNPDGSIGKAKAGGGNPFAGLPS
jgi:hypothetical protein